MLGMNAEGARSDDGYAYSIAGIGVAEMELYKLSWLVLFLPMLLVDILVLLEQLTRTGSTAVQGKSFRKHSFVDIDL